MNEKIIEDDMSYKEWKKEQLITWSIVCFILILVLIINLMLPVIAYWVLIVTGMIASIFSLSFMSSGLSSAGSLHNYKSVFFGALPFLILASLAILEHNLNLLVILKW